MYARPCGGVIGTRGKKFSSGVTLIELMIVVVVVAILAAIAVPALQTMIAANELNTTQENLAQTLRKARGFAMSRATLASVAITASSRQAVLQLSDGSLANEIITLPSSIAVDANASYTFNPSGSVTGAGSTTLSSVTSPGALKQRITVSVSGEVTLAQVP